MELAEHNRKRSNEWYHKNKQLKDSQSVHHNRAQAQQKRRAAEKERKNAEKAQHLESLKQCDPNNPIHRQPLADKNVRQFDKENLISWRSVRLINPINQFLHKSLQFEETCFEKARNLHQKKKKINIFTPKKYGGP